MYLVDDPELPDPYPVDALETCELHAAAGSRGLDEGAQRVASSSPVIRRQPSRLALGGRRQFNSV